MNNNPYALSSYDYALPSELIASHPIVPKQRARLLVYDRESREIIHATFLDFRRYIPRDSLLVFNDTKVIKARVFGHKESGGKVELLYHRALDEGRFLFQIRGKVHLHQTLLLPGGILATIHTLRDEGMREVSLRSSNEVLRLPKLLEWLQSYGHVPLPPYIKREDDTSDSLEYQSVFAKHLGAVAAPTASLHFDQSDMEQLLRLPHAFVTLHVGAGTFLGVECEDIRKHRMHSEYFVIPAQSAKAIDEASKVLAIGTTAARTVEYYARTKKREGACDLFLHPGNRAQKVTSLLTNFHLPKSTLLMLVSAFVGLEECQRIYAEAIKEHYRFYSYGDGMLIL
ncbi:MAG: tRNA preQ1(34) S-adenosylmethionine ribosyltransferase-isomerase QueA [Wolinella sp.]